MPGLPGLSTQEWNPPARGPARDGAAIHRLPGRRAAAGLSEEESPQGLTPYSCPYRREVRKGEVESHLVEYQQVSARKVSGTYFLPAGHLAEISMVSPESREGSKST
jgi:hypothetical protein